MTIDAATDAARAATTTHSQTGPRTEAGKSKSSRNSIRTGLYAARDFVRPEEEEEYAQTLIKLMDELTPGNSVEQTFATEIMGATWRLRRCRLVEENFSSIEDLNVDPMIDDRTEKQQKSVDRARAQSHLIFRRSLDELRKLQKGLESPLRGESRTIQEQIADKFPTPKPAPTSDAAPAGMDALMNLAESQLAQRFRESGLDSFCKPVGQVPDLPSTKPVATTSAPAVSNKIPRNAPCPCRSGAKYKKCCGGPAASALKPAA
jgi:vacuolar-type H+-ATPase subunit H